MPEAFNGIVGYLLEGRPFRIKFLSFVLFRESILYSKRINLSKSLSFCEISFCLAPNIFDFDMIYDSANDLVDITEILSEISLSIWKELKFYALLLQLFTEYKLFLEPDKSDFEDVFNTCEGIAGPSIYLETFMFLTKFLILSVPKLSFSVFLFIKEVDLTDILSSFSRCYCIAAERCTTFFRVYLFTLSLMRVLNAKGIAECESEFLFFLRFIVEVLK